MTHQTKRIRRHPALDCDERPFRRKVFICSAHNKFVAFKRFRATALESGKLKSALIGLAQNGPVLPNHLVVEFRSTVASARFNSSSVPTTGQSQTALARHALGPMELSYNGQFRFAIMGLTGQRCSIESSTPAPNWL